MELLLKNPSKIDINYYGKRVPSLSLKLSRNRSGANFRKWPKQPQITLYKKIRALNIFLQCPPCFSFEWCALAPPRGPNRRERVRAVLVSLNLNFILFRAVRGRRAVGPHVGTL